VSVTRSTFRFERSRLLRYWRAFLRTAPSSSRFRPTNTLRAGRSGRGGGSERERGRQLRLRLGRVFRIYQHSGHRFGCGFGPMGGDDTELRNTSSQTSGQPRRASATTAWTCCSTRAAWCRVHASAAASERRHRPRGIGAVRASSTSALAPQLASPPRPRPAPGPRRARQTAPRPLLGLAVRNTFSGASGTPPSRCPPSTTTPRGWPCTASRCCTFTQWRTSGIARSRRPVGSPARSGSPGHVHARHSAGTRRPLGPGGPAGLPRATRLLCAPRFPLSPFPFPGFSPAVSRGYPAPRV